MTKAVTLFSAQSTVQFLAMRHTRPEPELDRDWILFAAHLCKLAKREAPELRARIVKKLGKYC